MEKGETIPKYLTNFFQCRDELGSVGITVVDDDFVSLALLGLHKSWHNCEFFVNELHAWCQVHWDLCGIWIVVLPFT